MAPTRRVQPPMTTIRDEQRAEPGRRAVWTAGLAIATGAGVATAHGLYQVAAAAQVAAPIAWLYPLITDGLALVAYAASSRLGDGGRRYAATIVVLAASLSGLAQAVYLAGGIARTTAAPVGLRFGVGAWPAIAAAITAHLLHLIATGATSRAVSQQLGPDALFNVPSVQPYNGPSHLNGVQPNRSIHRSRMPSDPVRRAGRRQRASGLEPPPAAITPDTRNCRPSPSSWSWLRSPAAPPELS